jgi:hypothetical protein
MSRFYKIDRDRSCIFGPMTIQKGSCHCGTVRFEVDVATPIEKLMECNCSRCRRVGWLLWFGPRGALRITSSEGRTTTYRFHRNMLEHHFCPSCGIAPFSFGEDPKHGATVAVNVRCLEDLDFYELPVERFDGASI